MAVKGLLGLAKAAKNYGNPPLPGAPMPANVPGAGLVNIGPNPAAEQAAIQYSQSSGIPYTPVTSFMPADPQFGARVAREYELMPHDPTNRRVQQSYGALADEIAGQYEAMLRAGIKPEFNQNPYPQSPYLGLMDMLETGRLQVYPTRAGFGMDDAFDSSQNLLLAESPFKISGQPATFNDLFRAVHDFQGHAKVGAGFRGAGEEMAYLSHAGTMSPDALKALASETRGQNSWLNYGPFGDANRTAGIDDTVFAEQKSGLLPNWAIQERLPELDVRRQRFNELRAQYDTGLEGAIDDSGNLTLVHYSPKPIERVDPNFYGKGLSGRTREELNRSYSEDFVPRSYYGIEADVNPYAKELGLGSNKVETQIDAAQIYDAKKDPEGLWKDGKGDVTKSEKNLWDKGYSGYFVNNQRLGKVAAIFDPLDVTKKLMVPLVPTAAAGLTALAPQEAEAGAAGLLNKIRAYHGSPHDFDRFSTESIGTGEGAQQYGHGLYFAEREPTALSYRDALTPRDYEFENYLAMQNEMAENSGNYTRMEFLQQAMNHDTPQDFRNIASDSDYDDDYREMAADFADEMEAFRNESGEPVNFGRMYEVDIDAQPEELLDFDAPLSEQSEQVQNAFSFKPAPMPNFTADDVKKTLSDNPAYRYAVEGFPAAETVEKALSQANKPVLQNTGPLGAEAYNKLARELADETSDLTGAKSASEALRQSGVKGIKYADAQTRFSPKGRTSNYVIFDDATVDIARKYGVSMPVAAGLLSGGLGTEQAQAAEYREAPVVQEQSFGDMVNEYAQINQRAQAAEAQKFDTLMREDARLRDMGSVAFGQVSPELAAYRRSQMLPTIGEIGIGVLEGAVDTVDFVSQLPTAISTMTMPKRTPLRDRLGGLLDYSFVDERDQRARDQARLIGGLLSPI